MWHNLEIRVRHEALSSKRQDLKGVVGIFLDHVRCTRERAEKYLAGPCTGGQEEQEVQTDIESMKAIEMMLADMLNPTSADL